MARDFGSHSTKREITPNEFTIVAFNRITIPTGHDCKLRVGFKLALSDTKMTMKTTTQHTPGPWRVITDNGIVSVDGLHITDVKGYGANDIENDINARLIAAAPELLAALESLVEYADTMEAIQYEFDGIDAAHSPQLRAAREAIAKAKGVTP